MDERITEIILKYNYAELEQLIKDLQLFTTVKLAIDTHSDKMKELNDAWSLNFRISLPKHTGG